MENLENKAAEAELVKIKKQNVAIEIELSADKIVVEDDKNNINIHNRSSDIHPGSDHADFEEHNQS